ncbi:LrgB family protein [Nocardioides sp. BP30]|uniref:LrgB family protein n=1 Tax=Nocardioides sp. BP30 TaxID=3036374 RepID=UPI00246981D7|nr:LrgB family protein [Nocardioides sp. BP30]WGL53057.1 LrgB family protein [Nocardioides sp. BP30]
MRVHETWSWLHTSPLPWLVLTLAAYELGRRLRARTGHPLAQPVLIALVIVCVTIEVTGTSYADYRSATDLIAFFLGPATVALAIPLHRQTHRLRGLAVPMLLGLLAGTVVSTAGGILLVRWCGGGEALARTMAPKATTTPVAIALADRFDGVAALAAVFAIGAGTLGAVAGPTVLSLLRIREHRARGLALGAVSHGIGTSRALHDDPIEGAFAGLSMGVTALLTCLVLPVAVALML